MSLPFSTLTTLYNSYGVSPVNSRLQAELLCFRAKTKKKLKHFSVIFMNINMVNSEINT